MLHPTRSTLPISLTLAIALLPLPALARDRLETLKDPAYWKQLCTLLASSKPTEALPACERAIELQPGNAQLWARYGAVQLGLKQYPDAIASLEQAIKRQPKNSQALTDQCLAWLELGSPESAIAACEKALTLNANWGERSPVVAQRYRSQIIDQPEVYQQAVAFYTQQLEKTPNDSQTLLYRAEALLKLGQFRAAIESSDQAIAGNGNWGAETPAIAWYTRGLSQRRLGELPLAIASFDSALQLNPNHAPTWLEQANTLRQLKRPTEALVSYSRAIELPSMPPVVAQALLGQCVVLNQLQQGEAAIAACKKAVQTDSNLSARDRALSWNQQSLALATSGKPEEALAAANRAVGLWPDWGQAWSDRAVVLWYLKRYEEALASVEKALSLTPAEARIWANQGRILRSLNQPANALTAYAEALKRDPTDATLWANQSAVQWSLGDHPAALESANRAIAIDPKLALAWQNHAAALVALKQYADAQTSYERAIDLEKTNAASWTGLGLVLLQLQQYPEALKALQTAVSLNPKNPIAQQALNVLTQWQQQPLSNQSGE